MFDLSDLDTLQREWFEWALHEVCTFPWPDHHNFEAGGLVDVRFNFRSSKYVAIVETLPTSNNTGGLRMSLGNTGPNAWSDPPSDPEREARLDHSARTLIHEAAHCVDYGWFSDADRQAVLDLWGDITSWRHRLRRYSGTETFADCFVAAFADRDHPTGARVWEWVHGALATDEIRASIPQVRDIVLAAVPTPEPLDPEPEEDDMPRRSTEAWWRRHWGAPCNLHDPETVTIGGQQFRTDGRMVVAWQALDAVFARHGVTVNPPYPDGDSGMFNCRHIGNDPERPWSTHAWAGALDRNWDQNPDGSRLVTDLPRGVIDDVHALRTRSGAPVFRWGGDWDRDPRTGHSYYDAMHFEITASPAELATGVIDPNDRPDPRPSPEEDDDMLMIWKGDTHHWWLVDGFNRRHLKDRDEAGLYAWSGARHGGDKEKGEVAPIPVDQEFIDRLTEV